jgi:hypothetical protein
MTPRREHLDEDNFFGKVPSSEPSPERWSEAFFINADKTPAASGWMLQAAGIAGGSPPLLASRSWRSRGAAVSVRAARARWRSWIARISRQPTRRADACVGQAA